VEEAFFFTSSMPAMRLTEPDTIPELKGPTFLDYFRPVADWDDHEPLQVQYIVPFTGPRTQALSFKTNPTVERSIGAMTAIGTTGWSPRAGTHCGEPSLRSVPTAKR